MWWDYFIGGGIVVTGWGGYSIISELIYDKRHPPKKTEYIPATKYDTHKREIAEWDAEFQKLANPVRPVGISNIIGNTYIMPVIKQTPVDTKHMNGMLAEWNRNEKH